MEPAVTMQPTRWEILQLIKRRGRATVEELANHLGVTPMAVRLHLVVLERDGLVSRGTLRHGPGRPALVYTLTPRADDLFPKSYDVLATTLLDGLRESDGKEGVVKACQSAAEQLIATYRPRVAGKSFEERVREVSVILKELGGDVVWEQQDGHYLLKEYNCPYRRVAERHREVCGIDRQVLHELLDADLEFTESLLDRSVHCTYIVRPR
jgi:predicted ArsR family transcriptional regulator